MLSETKQPRFAQTVPVCTQLLSCSCPISIITPSITSHNLSCRFISSTTFSHPEALSRTPISETWVSNHPQPIIRCSLTSPPRTRRQTPHPRTISRRREPNGISSVSRDVLHKKDTSSRKSLRITICTESRASQTIGDEWGNKGTNISRGSLCSHQVRATGSILSL